jgi:hypothetical protein
MTRLGRISKDVQRCRDDAARVPADQPVSTFDYGDRPFCVVPEREAWHPEYRRFLLHATRVRQYDARRCLERNEVEITRRRDDPDPLRQARSG